MKGIVLHLTIAWQPMLLCLRPHNLMLRWKRSIKLQQVIYNNWFLGSLCANNSCAPPLSQSNDWSKRICIKCWFCYYSAESTWWVPEDIKTGKITLPQAMHAGKASYSIQTVSVIKSRLTSDYSPDCNPPDSYVRDAVEQESNEKRIRLTPTLNEDNDYGSIHQCKQGKHPKDLQDVPRRSAGLG